jgi:hypothetical protein
MVEQRPWHGWLAGARRERVRMGTWNLGPRHGRDACGALASWAAATSQLQGWTRATAGPLQESGMGGPRLAKGGLIDSHSMSVAGGRKGKAAVLTSWARR